MNLHGIPLKIHRSFLVMFLMPLTVFVIGTTESIWDSNLNHFFFITTLTAFLALVVCWAYCFVLTHELGHVFAAQYHGIPCQRIDVVMFACAARINVPYDNPKQEFWVTFCGPLVNVAWMTLAWPFRQELNVWLDTHSVADAIFDINLVLLIFNLIPVHPMDGGRLFRSLIQLIFRFRPLQAAKITVYVSIFAAIIGSALSFYLKYYMAALLLPLMCPFTLSEYQNVRKREEQKSNSVTRELPAAV